jgi:Putative mono-oxygenase ydhR
MMSKTILQINYKFNSSRADHTALVTPIAEPIASVPGLVWKIWLINEADHEAGGIYLFESRQAAQGFVNSPAVKDFGAHPMISAVNAKMFEPDEALSKITRGPLAEVQMV